MNKDYFKRIIEKESLYSQYLHKERHMRVFLPPGFEESKKYPVIYGQDGVEFFNFGRVATHATKLILDEEIEPIIIVGVEVDMPMRTEEYSPDGVQFEAYCKFFVEELIPYVEELYPIDEKRRVLAGDSLGGTVSLHLALDYPEISNEVLSLSGAFMAPTEERLKASEDDLTELNIYMVIGTDETEVKTDRGTYDFLTKNRKTKQLLKQRNAKIQYVEKPGKHLWGFWQNELPDALRYFFA